jgi:hypothetical protein
MQVDHVEKTINEYFVRLRKIKKRILNLEVFKYDENNNSVFNRC